MMKPVLALLFLLTGAFSGLLAALPESLIANRINQPKNSGARASSSIRVEYQTQALPKVRAWVIKHGLVLEDLEPSGVGKRIAGLSSLRRGTEQLKALARTSGFLRVRTSSVPYPGIFYVAAKRGHGREVRRYLDAIHVRPEVHGTFGFSPFSEVRLFQCKAPAGEERFWVKTISDHPGVYKAGFTGDSAYTGQVRVSSRLSQRQERALTAAARKRGLFFEDSLFGDELTLYVPPGEERSTIRLLSGNKISASLAYMPLDGDEILSVPIKQATVTRDVQSDLSLTEICERIETGLKQGFPNAVIARYADDWGFCVEDTHKGIKILHGYETGRWERVRIPIHVGGFRHGNLRLHLTLATWTSSKLGDSPPTNPDAWHRYSEGSRSIPEDAFVQKLGAKISSWIGKP